MASMLLTRSGALARLAAPLRQKVLVPALSTVPRRTFIVAKAGGKDEPKDLAKKEEPKAELSKQGQGFSDLDLMMPMPFRRMTDHMMQMQREMDSMMSAFGMPSLMSDPFFSAPLAPRRATGLAPLLANESFARLLPLEVQEDEKQFTITAEVPGFDKKDIKITLSDDGLLTMSGEMKQEEEEQAEEEPGKAEGKGKEAEKGAKKPRGAVMKSRRYASFSRSVLLPEHVDKAAIKAVTEHGVLTVTVPKVEAPKPQVKEIPVA